MGYRKLVSTRRLSTYGDIRGDPRTRSLPSCSSAPQASGNRLGNIAVGG